MFRSGYNHVEWRNLLNVVESDDITLYRLKRDEWISTIGGSERWLKRVRSGKSCPVRTRIIRPTCTSRLERVILTDYYELVKRPVGVWRVSGPKLNPATVSPTGGVTWIVAVLLKYRYVCARSYENLIKPGKLVRFSCRLHLLTWSTAVSRKFRQDTLWIAKYNKLINWLFIAWCIV